MFRKMRRFKQQISAEECVRILREQPRGVLSMIGDDGYPYGIPLDHWYSEKDNKLYCGTHTPQGYENLEANRVMDLDNPVPTVLAEVYFSAQKATGKYVCSVCGYVYDPAEHDSVAFEELPDDWRCPRCKQPKAKFNKA